VSSEQKNQNKYVILIDFSDEVGKSRRIPLPDVLPLFFSPLWTVVDLPPLYNRSTFLLSKSFNFASWHSVRKRWRACTLHKSR